MLLNILKILLLLTIGILIEAGLTIIWAMIVQFFLDKWD